MKLASLSGGASAGASQYRGGRLVVVSEDLAWCADATHIVPSLQGALDDWQDIAPLLQALSVDLEHGAIPRERFHEREALAPLPRAYLWMNAASSVGLNHAAGDRLRGARAALPAGSPWQMSAGVCVVTGDVEPDASAAQALGAVRLVGLVADGAAQGVLAGDGTAFSPVFVTPDGLGEAWQGGRLGPALLVSRNGQSVAPSGAPPMIEPAPSPRPRRMPLPSAAAMCCASKCATAKATAFSARSNRLADLPHLR